MSSMVEIRRALAFARATFVCLRVLRVPRVPYVFQLDRNYRFSFRIRSAGVMMSVNLVPSASITSTLTGDRR